MAHKDKPKKGRPREYKFEPGPGSEDQNWARTAAILHELRERVIDQVKDLPLEALSFRPQGTPLSIGALVVHLVWAEAGWIKEISGYDVLPDFRETINEIGQSILEGDETPTTSMRAAELILLCRRIEEEATIPALSNMKPGLDTVLTRRNRKMTPRGVLMHLIWHWTFHSAHIGLLREQWGSDYTWTLGSLGD